MKEYVTRNEVGTLRVTGSRVSLASVVHSFWRGETPEAIAQSFPSLSLEQVYGTIAHYLAHRDEVDREMDDLEAVWRGLRASGEEPGREIRARLLAARARTVT